MSRFVIPGVVTLPLSDGDTVTVRARLTHGEAQDMYLRSCRDATPETPEDARYTIDRVKATNALVTAYLVDWTFRDADGRVLSIRGLRPEELVDVIRNLEQEAFAELFAAISAHDQAAKAAQKKTVEPVPA